MTTIRLLDARRGLNRKCEELFGNAKIAEAIYRYLCDGIEECEDVEPQRKKGKWVKKNDAVCYWYECSVCGEKTPLSIHRQEWHSLYCPNCGADMRGEGDE